MKLFPITLEMEDEAVGAVLRLVRNLKGVVNVRLDLDAVPSKGAGKAKSAEPRTPRQPKDADRPPPKDIIIRYLLKKGAASLTALRAELTKYGYMDHTASTTMTPMRKEGITENAGIGMHKLTNKFLKSLEHHTNGAALPALPAPRKGIGRPRKPRGQGATGLQTMLGMCGHPARRKAITEALVKQGFSAKTLNNIIGKAKHEGWINIPEPGVYQITEKGAAHLKAISAPQA